MKKTEQLRQELETMGLGPRALAGFLRLVEKYRSGPARIDRWETVASPEPEDLPLLSGLAEPDEETESQELSRLAVCKLNGGLGTTMGCHQPKSTLPVRDDQTFLDLIVDQLAALNGRTRSAVPLLLMNSFYTDAETGQALARYAGRLPVRSFLQNRYPRLEEATLQPLSESALGEEAWYPPGHGDLYPCLGDQGILDALLAGGREVLFVSNADNLGATVDGRILHHMLSRDIPFLMEMTAKTPADVKGGTLYRRGGKLKLLELAHVPPEHVEEFCGQEKFHVFNTNNIWIHLRHLKRALAAGPLDLDLIVNRKEVGGVPVVQLETAVGSALEWFPGGQGLIVERDRFLPVKKTDDLLLVRSDLFILDQGRLRRNPTRTRPGLPVVRLGENFSHIEEFDRRVPVAPSLIDLESLEISGDVRFEGAAYLKGRVRLAGDARPLVIPAGARIENRDLEG